MTKEQVKTDSEFPQDNQKPYALFKDKGGARATTYDKDGNAIQSITEPSTVAFPILRGDHAIVQIKSLINDKGFTYLGKHNIAVDDAGREKVRKYLDQL